MAAPQGAFLAAVLLLVSSLFLCSSSSPACPQSCTCGRAPLLNCSSAGLSSVPQHIRDSVTELDLSHNLLKSVTLHRPHRNLRSVWLGNNSIPHLSVCSGRNLEGQYLRDAHGSGPWNRRRCVSWAPTLQLLSVERNQLEQLPEGLEGIESLQVLHLSFNRISTLQPGDLSHLQQLKELHLQHNLITSLHPQTFQDLAQLKVLDLSFNMLTSLHPLMYLTLHNIGTDVRLLGNRWQCDCRMHSLRRRMAFDRNRGLQVWSITCASPAVLSGRDLLQLQDDDLNCLSAANIPDLHQDVTVYSGSEILLSCSAEDSIWWTPSGQTSLNQPEGGLLISDITEKDTGLYVCVSDEKQVASVFNLQISKIGGARRKPRSLSGTSQHIIQQGPSNRIARQINPREITQSDLALAVSLSIFITFLIAFILGVLARPCVDVLREKVTKKKNSRETNTVVSVEQRQYDNEAFSNGEEPEVIEHHRERRVTFSTVDYREGSSVQYYDTMASGTQESINNAVVIECEATEVKNIKHTAEDSGSESGSHQSNSEDKLNGGRNHTSPGHRYNMEFEPIPDPDELEERRRISSLSSDSSLSEKEFKEDDTTPKYPVVIEDPVQQKADFSVATKVDGPQISTNSKNEMPSFISKPWLPHADNRNPADPGDLEENEELFEFSDSIQSPSPSSESMFDSFKKSKIAVASTSEKQKRDSVSSSSSSSHISEDEPTFYTVNPDQNDASFKKHAVRPDHSFSSDSSESDKEPDKHTNKPETDKDTRMNITPKPWTKWRGVYWDPSQSKTLDASEINSDKKTQLHMSIAPLEVSQTIGHNAETNWPGHEHKTDIKVSSPSSNSSSSSDSGDETGHLEKQKPGKLSIAPRQFQEARTKNYQGVRGPSVDSDISSSSDSEEEIQGKEAQERVQMPILPNRSSQKQSHEHEIKRPAIIPEYPGTIKKDSVMKETSSKSSSSSSSDSEDEIHQKVQKTPGKWGIAPRSFQESQTKSPDPNAKWPTIDLKHIPHIQRRLDIKAPSAGSHTSSSSDSEEEKTKYIKKQAQGIVQMPILPSRSPQKVIHEHETRRPPIPPARFRSIKKDSDIKKPSSDSSSSSSSDSEDETGHKVQQSPGKLGIAPPQFQESPDPNAKWPTIDLQHIPHIKRRLDIKAPSAGSYTSSSSDSEEDTLKKQAQGSVQMPMLPSRSPQKVSHEHEIRRPAIPPERPRSLKKSGSSSSSSSDSEDETHHKVQQSPGKLGIAPPRFQESPDPKAKWPTIDLQHIPHIKRRLDIKGPSASSYTSSSSDSEEDTLKKQEQGHVQMPILPNRSSQKVSHEHEKRRPAIPPEGPTSFKKSDSSSSSSSDSEDETHHKVQQSPGKLGIAQRPFQESSTKSPDPNAKWPTIDLQHIPHIQRRLDIKAPSAGSHTSSSSDSEEEIQRKQAQGSIHMPILSNRSSQKVSHEHEIKPAIPPERPRSFKKSDSSSSSSSDSEDETGHKVQQSPGKLGIAPPRFQESPDPNAKWPTIDLKHIPHIQRRLDIKGPSASSYTSSSSDSEEDTLKKQGQGSVQMPMLPSRSPQKVSHEHEIRRPAIPPERPRSFKKSDSSSSSSSDSEDETHHKVQQSPGKLGIAPPRFQESPDPKAKWPTIDLQHIPHIKRRLDIKAPLASSYTFSSSGSKEDTLKKQEQGSVQMPMLPSRSPQKISHEHENRRPAIPPERPRSFKKSESSSSSSSDSEDETHHKVQQSSGKLGIAQRPFQESPDPNVKWPTIDLQHIPHIKRGLDIKAPSAGSYTSSSSDSEEDTTKYLKEQEQGGTHMPIQPTELSQTKSQYAKTQRPGIHFKHITSLSSSSSESEDENRGHTEKQKLGSTGFPFPRSPKSSSSSEEREGRTTALSVKVDSSLRSRKSTLFNVPHSSRKDPNINLEKYVVITDDLEDKSSKDNINTTPEINSELQSRWATMNLGISRFRKRLEITSPRHQPSRLPLSPPPDSPLFSAESETDSIKNQKRMVVGMQEILHTPTDPSLNLQNKPVKPSDSSSSSSSSEDEITENRVPPDMTYNYSPIAYKRLIIKTSSLPDNSFSPNSKNQINVAQDIERDRSTSLAPKRVSSLSFEDTVRRKIEQRHNTDVDIPPEIRWTGVGHYLSNLSTPAPNTGLNAVSTSPQRASPAKPDPPPLSSSSNKRDNKTKEDTWKSDLMPTNKLSSISTSSGSSASGSALYRLYNSPNATYEAPSTVFDDRKERRGLSALKAMSSERKKWDPEGFSEGDVRRQQADASLSYLKPELDIKPLPKQPLTQLHLPSASLDKGRAMELLYGVPRYRSHDIKPPQATPPPIPATLKPDEAVGLTWRSPQGSEKQGLEGNRSYQQQTQNTEEPGSPSLASEYPPVYLNTSNITHV